MNDDCGSTSARWRAAAGVLVIAQGLLAGWVWHHGAEGPLPMHFNWRGEVDRWGSREEAAAVLGGMAALTALLGLCFARALRSASAAPSAGHRRAMGVAAWLVLALQLLASALVAALGLDALRSAGAQDVALYGAQAAGWAVLLVLGAVLGKTVPNAHIGLRVRWTRDSRLAWERGNRLLGQMYFLGAIAGLALMPLAGRAGGFVLLGAVTLLGAVAATVESRRAWQRDPERTG